MIEIAKEKMPLASLIQFDFSKGIPEEIKGVDKVVRLRNLLQIR